MAMPTVRTAGTRVMKRRPRYPYLPSDKTTAAAIATAASIGTRSVMSPGKRCCSDRYGMTRAEKTSAPDNIECSKTIARGGLDAIRARTYRESSTIPGGTAGKTYPGSFDWEIEKKARITAIQVRRNASRLSASRFLSRRAAQTQAAATNTDHGTQPSSVTGR